ncbi:hypothetical protein BU17DRAFT_43811, partial [Hysterangium stoloniferum]
HLIEHKWIALSTFGILFLGTPHQGADIAETALNLLKIVSLYSNTNVILLKHLTSNSELIQGQLSGYNPIGKDFQTKFFYENLPTKISGGISKIIVSRSSAVVPGAANAEPIGLNKDHRNMSKFESTSDDDFCVISSVLCDMATKAQPAIEHRWADFREKDGKYRIVWINMR